MYTDDGISGLSIRKRDGFNRMVADALDGKIDLILTKSLSRFARNTVDALTTIRSLKAVWVAVYFQKENINTMDSAGEFLITLMSSFAEEESRSISEMSPGPSAIDTPKESIISLDCFWGIRATRMAKFKSMKPGPESCGSSICWLLPEKAAQISAAFLWIMVYSRRDKVRGGSRTPYAAF